MPDGSKRKRRQDKGVKGRWYAFYRSMRFNRRLGLELIEVDIYLFIGN